MTELGEGTVTANGIRIHYLRSGGEKPPIVLAHGVTDSGACWASMIRLLAGDFDVVAYDARGHGESDAPPTGYSAEDQADDLLGLVDALELERPILMGHSMGGGTVGWAGVKRPDAFRALVLEDSGTSAPTEGVDPAERRRLRRGFLEWLRGLQAQSIDELVAGLETSDPRWPREDRRPWAESKHQVRDEAIEGFAMREGRALSEHYSGIRCPVLFLKADAGERHRVEHREIVSRLPKGEIVHVEGAGHNVRRDEPERTAYHLGRFLAGV